MTQCKRKFHCPLHCRDNVSCSVSYLKIPLIELWPQETEFLEIEIMQTQACNEIFYNNWSLCDGQVSVIVWGAGTGMEQLVLTQTVPLF